MTRKLTLTPSGGSAGLHHAGHLLRWAALAPPLLAAAVSLLWAALLPHDGVIALIREDGPIESLTVLLYALVALALWCVPRPGTDTRTRAAVTLMLLAFAARELDLHKLFTGTSVLKVSFYLHDAPLQQKLLALPVVLLVAATGVWLALRHAGRIWRSLRQGHPVAITVAVFLVTLVCTKVIDRSFAILAEDFGVVMSTGLDAVLSALEEVGECSLPLIAAVGLSQYQRLLRSDPQA